MQDINQNKINIICPQVTCIILICLFLSSCFINIYYAGVYSLVIIYHIIIYYLINEGIKKKDYSSYNKGMVLSMIYSIIATFSKIGIFIYLIILVAIDFDDDSLTLTFAVFLMSFIFFSIFLDWLLTIVLFNYNQRIKNLCTNNNINNMILIDPLNPQNLNTPNNFVQTNMINNQNLNTPYVQPYYPNANVQPNDQNLNTPYVQPNYPNINAQPIDQHLNNNDVKSTGNSQ